MSGSQRTTRSVTRQKEEELAFRRSNLTPQDPDFSIIPGRQGGAASESGSSNTSVITESESAFREFTGFEIQSGSSGSPVNSVSGDNIEIPAPPAPDQVTQIPLQENLNAVTEQNFTMANAQLVPLKDALRVVPEFDGENISLTQFLESLDESLAMIQPENEANLVKLIRSKLIGEARKSIQGNTFQNLNQLKEFLKDIYFSSMTVYQLQGHLGNMIQEEGESVIKFVNRVRDTGLRISETYKMEGRHTPEEIERFKTTTEANVMECFKRGLRADIEHKLGAAATLRDLVRDAIKIERELFAKDSLRKTNHRENRRRNVYTCHCSKPDSLQNEFEEGDFSICNAYQGSYNKCAWCSGNHLVKECPEILSKIEQNAKGVSSQVVCGWCSSTTHSMKDCVLAKRDLLGSKYCQLCNKFGHSAPYCRAYDIKKNETVEKPNAVKGYCRYCKEEVNHTLENCPKKAKYDAYKASKNSQTPLGASDQKGSKPENRSINTIKEENTLDSSDWE